MLIELMCMIGWKARTLGLRQSERRKQMYNDPWRKYRQVQRTLDREIKLLDMVCEITLCLVVLGLGIALALMLGRIGGAI